MVRRTIPGDRVVELAGLRFASAISSATLRAWRRMDDIASVPTATPPTGAKSATGSNGTAFASAGTMTKVFEVGRTV
jgi:hypothetical protein